MIDIIRAVLGFALTLFIPGYAFILALYPGKKELGLTERIALSAVMSIAITLVSALFLDLALGLDYTGENMIYSLVIFSVICLFIWIIKIKGRYR